MKLPPTGKQVVTGESMMITDGAKAAVVYDYGNDDRKCVAHYAGHKTYAGPNTYVSDDGCPLPRG